MRITGRSGVGYHPNTGVKSSHTSSMHRMSRDETRMTLFSPKAFQVSTGRNSGVGDFRHTGEVTKEKTVGKAESEGDVARFRIQFGC